MSPSTKETILISVIVPVLNEEDNVAPLVAEIAQAAKTLPISEIIFVDDGSTDRTAEYLKNLRAMYPALRNITHSRCSGQSAALWTGVKAAGNDLIVTLDGDGQNDPADIGQLFSLYTKYQNDYQKIMVAGERLKRNDNWIRRFSSRLANRIRSGLLRDNTRDTGCSLKMFRRKDYLALPYFDHMHRFLPALMIRDNVRVLHTQVSHRPRTRGLSKYGTLDRLAVGISDLWGVWWLMKRPFVFPETYEEMSDTQ